MLDTDPSGLIAPAKRTSPEGRHSKAGDTASPCTSPCTEVNVKLVDGLLDLLELSNDCSDVLEPSFGIGCSDVLEPTFGIAVSSEKKEGIPTSSQVAALSP